jgi:nucleotide-binding universal stress UspA family protein
MNDAKATFAHVIVGVDGRTGGNDAIALARILAAGRARLTLAHVYAGAPIEPAAPAVPSEASGSALQTPAQASGSLADVASMPGGRADSERLLEDERAKADVDAELVAVPASSVGRGLDQLAEREGADLLVVGSSHRGFFGRVFVGDDTRAALNGSPCAIGVAPVAYAHALTPMKTIGVGFDGSDESDAALALARELAQEHGGIVRALRVVQIVTSAYAGFSGAAWGDALESVLTDAKHEMAGIEGAQGDATLGIPGEELAAFGDTVDLLVVGSRAYGPVRRLMLGSTSQYLVGHARCPLVVIPRTSRAGQG